MTERKRISESRKAVIGKKLRYLRKCKGMSQEDVAKKVRITRSTISNYEIGRRTPHITELQKFARVYGVGLDYFGVSAKDDAFELIARAQEVFESPDVDDETKEDLYLQFLKLYLSMKGEKHE